MVPLLCGVSEGKRTNLHMALLLTVNLPVRIFPFIIFFSIFDCLSWLMRCFSAGSVVEHV